MSPSHVDHGHWPVTSATTGGCTNDFSKDGRCERDPMELQIEGSVPDGESWDPMNDFDDENGLTNDATAVDPKSTHDELSRCAIHRFDLSRCPAITSAGLRQICPGHPIAVLDLSYCTQIDSEVFGHAASCADTLTVLRLAHCETLSPEDFGGLRELQKLQELDLQSTLIDGQGLPHIPAGVSILNLMDTAVGAWDVHCGLRHLSRLESINLSETAISYGYFDDDLSDNDDSAAGQSWTFFSDHPHLRRVDIAACLNLVHYKSPGASIDDVRGRFYQNLCSNRELRWVNVSYLALDRESIRLLMALPHVEFLGVFGTNILEHELRADIELAASFSHEQLLVTFRHLGTRSARVVRGVLKSLYDRLSSSADGQPSNFEPITEDLGMTDLVVSTLQHFDSHGDIQLITTAVLYGLTSERIKGQDPAARLRALRALIELLQQLLEDRNLQAFHVIQVVRNVCLTLRHFRKDFN